MNVKLLFVIFGLFVEFFVALNWNSGDGDEIQLVIDFLFVVKFYLNLFEISLKSKKSYIAIFSPNNHHPKYRQKKFNDCRINFYILNEIKLNV